LLSFEEVRRILKVQGSFDRGVQDIPLEAIVGSVNRYQDFTRDFLPLRNINPQRWAKVDILANGSIGLPPIDVYQIGNVFFVIDGNHRVSVARRMGAKRIQAYVREVPTNVELAPDDTLNDVLLKSEYASFLERTNLLRKRPDADLHLTEAGQYCLLEDHISVHRYYMGIDLKRPVSEEEAAVHWFDTVYLPVVEIIRNKGLQRDFPNRTEADLYLWIAEHRAYLEEALQTPLDPGRVVTNLSEQYSVRPDRAASRITERVLDALLPNTLEAGPEPGAWRKEKFQVEFAQTVSLSSENSLFTDILVPVNGTEIGWKALDQAILIAQRERSRLNGIHIVPTRLMNEEAAYVVQDRFDRTCSQAGIPGKLVLSPGPVARKIVERSRWNDLVVVNLTFPPSAQRISKMGSGFRELVLRCPRPILVVPGVISNLSKPLLAFDGSPKSVEALYVVTYLCAKWKLPLTVVSVMDNPRQIVEVQKQAEEYLSSHNVEFLFIVRNGPIAQEILMEAEDKSCDWIVMGGYGESPLVNLLLDTVVDQILRSSRKPMLLCR
jgi:nucleotide-binding universal stress UspA family protein